MFRIRTFDNISGKGLENFSRDCYEVSSDTTHYEGVLVRSSKLHGESFSENLLAIARAGVGVDNIPTDRCTEAGICVFNTPGANANGVAELVLSAMLLSSRRLMAGMDFCQGLKGDVDSVAKMAEKGKSKYGGHELKGRTLGVIGLGAIGGRVANLGSALGMNVIGYDPWLSVVNALQLPPHLVMTEYLAELFAKSDYISVHVPLFDNTRNLINTDALHQCRHGVRIFNFSRDGIVENEAILKGIAEEKVACYATDFTHPDLLGNEKVLCFPHLGASTLESEDNCAIMAVNQLRDYLEHGNVVNSINYPVVSVPRTTDHRVCIFTRNVPKMVASISSAMGKAELNIANLVNKSRGDVAYNLIDLDSPCPEAIIKKLRAIEGVIAVRSLEF